MVDIFLIKNNPDGTPLFKFRLANTKSISINMNMPVTPAPLPEETSKENVLIKIEGNSTDITYAWIIKDNTENQEVLAGIPSATTTQQITFFRNNLSTASIEDSFTFQIEYPVEPQIFQGILTGIKLSTAGKEMVTYNGRLTFLEGTAIAIYDIDVPTSPQNFTTTSTVAGEIDASWTAPLNSGSNPVTDYSFEYALVGSANFIKVLTGGALNVNVDSLAAGTYQVRIKAISNVGSGRPSILKEVVVA